MNQLRMLAVAGLVTIAMTGCTGDGPDGQATASPTAEALTALDVARCMRANGHPDFPDPVRDDAGNWAFPDSMPNYPVPEACTAVVRGQKVNDKERSELTAEEMRQRRRYSTCMRERGVPDFPDPDDEGNFPLSDQLRAAEDSPTMRDAREACRQYEPPRVNKPSPTPGTGS